MSSSTLSPHCPLAAIPFGLKACKMNGQCITDVPLPQRPLDHGIVGIAVGIPLEVEVLPLPIERALSWEANVAKHPRCLKKIDLLKFVWSKRLLWDTSTHATVHPPCLSYPRDPTKASKPLGPWKPSPGRYNWRIISSPRIRLKRSVVVVMDG